MNDAGALTADYEEWLGDRIPLDAAELERKHAEMAAHEYRFLRGTYYLWLDRLAEHVPEALAGSRVPVVGDLHVENFGTWRDADQVRRWGVNDFDELAIGPVLPDLIRLATSAVLAPHIAVEDKEVCATVLDTWARATPRAAIDLDENGAGHLRGLVPAFADADRFYARLGTGAPADLPADVVAAASAVAEPGWRPTWHHHEAGTGSLGHRRVVGVGPAADGAMHAREAKELGPGTSTWAAARVARIDWPQAHDGLYEQVRARIAGPGAAARVADWQVRDLAPDVVRIELTGLDGRPATRLLRAMARATADVHGVDVAGFAAAVTEVERLGHAGFRDAVDTMAGLTRADFVAYARQN